MLTACFTLEMTLKMCAYGLRRCLARASSPPPPRRRAAPQPAAYPLPRVARYFEDAFNRFDAVVVFSSLFELVLDYTHIDLGVNPSFLRAFRLLRVFKLAKSWKGCTPRSSAPTPAPTPSPLASPPAFAFAPTPRPRRSSLPCASDRGGRGAAGCATS